MVFCRTCGSKLEEQWVICPNCRTPLKEIEKAKQEIDKPKQENVVPHQTTIIDKRVNKVSERKRFIKNKKVFTLSISLIVVCVLAGVLGILYIQTNNRYDDLSGDYNNLVDDYEDLEQRYDDLLEDYNELLTDYNFLFGEYQSILSVLEDPLTDPIIPTISQVQSWLSGDDTNIHSYDNVTWMCGDFAAMLMTRAKAMNWRMRIAIMFYSFYDETEYGTTDPYGHHGHAFNLIYCQDGDDLDIDLDIYYIEPQTDTVWHVHDGSHNHLSYEIYKYVSGGVSGTMWEYGQYWINHYSYFA